MALRRNEGWVVADVAGEFVGLILFSPRRGFRLHKLRYRVEATEAEVKTIHYVVSVWSSTCGADGLHFSHHSSSSSGIGSL